MPESTSNKSDRMASLRRRIRRWLRPPRRLRFSRAGWFFCGGSVLLGVAAIGTGNNLLFLMLGGMLGFITLSGWLSEQMLRRLDVRRRVAARATAGEPVAHRLRRAQRQPPPPRVLRGSGRGAPDARAWIPVIDPGESGTGRAETLVGRARRVSRWRR